VDTIESVNVETCQTERVSNLDSPSSGQVVIEVKLLLQLQRLEPGVSLTTSTTRTPVRTFKEKQSKIEAFRKDSFISDSIWNSLIFWKLLLVTFYLLKLSIFLAFVSISNNCKFYPNPNNCVLPLSNTLLKFSMSFEQFFKQS
jgi:hypothetical protein